MAWFGDRGIFWPGVVSIGFVGLSTWILYSIATGEFSGEEVAPVADGNTSTAPAGDATGGTPGGEGTSANAPANNGETSGNRPDTSPNPPSGEQPGGNTEQPPVDESLKAKAERLDGIADTEEAQAKAANNAAKEARAAANASPQDAKLAAEAERLESVAKTETEQAEAARAQATKAQADFDAEKKAAMMKAEKEAADKLRAATDPSKLPEAKPGVKEMLEQSPVAATVEPGEGLILVTRDALEGMVQTGTLTQEMVDGITDPYLKAMFQAALNGDHDQLTSALTELYKQGGHYIPGAAGESTTLYPGDQLIIDKDGIHILRAGSGEILPIANAEGLVARPEGTPMTPPVNPAKVEGSAAPVATADAIIDGYAYNTKMFNADGSVTYTLLNGTLYTVEPGSSTKGPQ